MANGKKAPTAKKLWPKQIKKLLAKGKATVDLFVASARDYPLEVVASPLWDLYLLTLNNAQRDNLYRYLLWGIGDVFRDKYPDPPKDEDLGLSHLNDYLDTLKIETDWVLSEMGALLPKESLEYIDQNLNRAFSLRGGPRGVSDRSLGEHLPVRSFKGDFDITSCNAEGFFHTFSAEVYNHTQRVDTVRYILWGSLDKKCSLLPQYRRQSICTTLEHVAQYTSVGKFVGHYMLRHLGPKYNPVGEKLRQRWAYIHEED